MRKDGLAHDVVMQRLRIIINRWLKASLLTEEHVNRLFSGDYYYCVTFKPGPAVPDNGFAMIDAPDNRTARKLAAEMFNGDVASVMVEWTFDPRDRKCIGTYNEGDSPASSTEKSPEKAKEKELEESH